MIIVVSHGADLHASTVLKQLNAMGAEALLFDMAEFPLKTSMALKASASGFTAELGIGGRNVLTGDIAVVWWRRPLPHELDPALSRREDWNFAYGECHAAMSGLFSTLDAFWINAPLKDEKAAQKVYQLKLARQMEFRIPRTCITNRPDTARAFIAAEGARGTIYKAFSATRQAWRETRMLRPGEAELLEAVRHAPVIFQEYIEASVDLRITMIGGKVFAAAIHSQDTDYKVDFRMHIDSARYEAHQLPPELEDRLRRYMAALGLVYGAIDMRLTPDGDYVFLEINPCGQWLFAEDKAGLPITEALCALMIEKWRERGGGAAARAA